MNPLTVLYFVLFIIFLIPAATFFVYRVKKESWHRQISGSINSCMQSNVLQLDSLHRLAQKFGSPLSVPDLCKTVAEELYILHSFDAFLLDLYDEKTGNLTGIYYEDTEINAVRPSEVEAKHDPLYRERISEIINGTPLRLSHQTPAELPSNPFGYRQRPSLSLLFVPIRWSNRTIGILSIQKYQPGFYSETDLLLLQIISNLLGNALTLSHAEETLRSSEIFYHSILDNMTQNIFCKDINGRFTYANKRFCQTLVRPLEEIIGKTDFDFYPKELAEVFQQKDRDIIQTHKIYEAIEENQQSSGDKMFVQVVKSPVFDSDNKALGVQGIFWDVTDKRHMEETLLSIFKAVENSSDAIAIQNKTLKMIYYNRKFLDLFEYTTHELNKIGGTKALFTNFDIFMQIRHAIYAGNSWMGEVEMRTRSGDTLPISLRSDAIRDENNRIVGSIGLFTDITSRKLYEEELQNAKKAAEDASRAKSEFLANMSHEIRTPMNGIIGMTDLALDTEMSLEQREYLRLVKNSADSLLALLNDILDFSKIEAGKMDLFPVHFKLRDTLSDILRTLALRATQKDLELLCHVFPNVPDDYIGDPDRLRQIIVNLVGNSIKFTNQGEVIVVVKLQNQSEKESSLLMSVCDTGIGIPEEKIHSIFEAFEQADGSMSRKYGGTGLGLTISSKLVHMMKGQIRVESPWYTPDRAPGGPGTAMYFTLSLENAPEIESSVIEDIFPFLHNLPVLIVDDNYTNRRILQEMMTNWGMKPTITGDAFSAFELLHKAKENRSPFQLILIDSNMPDMDGFHLAEKITADASLTSLKIIMLTSAGQKGDFQRCKELGISAYLTKPVKQSELYNAVINTVRYSCLPVAVLPPIEEPLPSPGQQSIHVLLAEDNHVNQKLAVQILKKNQIQVTVANDGKEALSFYEQQRFDAILMDIQMPNVDGFEATEIIRKKEKKSGCRIPIIAMTAHAMKGDKDRCLNAGMDGYIAKPIQSRELIQTIHSFISAKNTAASIEEIPAVSYIEIESVVDKNAILERIDGDTDILREITGLYFEEIPVLMQAVEEAISRKEDFPLERSAHTLKGMVSNFAAPLAMKAALDLEIIGREKKIEEAPAAFETLKLEIDKLSNAIALLKESL